MPSSPKIFTFSTAQGRVCVGEAYAKDPVEKEAHAEAVYRKNDDDSNRRVTAFTVHEARDR